MKIATHGIKDWLEMNWISSISDIFRTIGGGYRLLVGSGNGGLIPFIVVGAILGAVCSIPAVLVRLNKHLPVGPVFWVNVIAGGLAGIAAGIPTGIACLIHALTRQDPSKVSSEKPSGFRWAAILTPVTLLLVCLVMLPGMCTTSVTMVLADDRSWFSKLLGDPIPTTTAEVTNWMVVVVVTLVLCVGGFVVGWAIDESEEPPK